MIYAAYLMCAEDGQYIYDEPSEEDAESIEEFLNDAAPGITTESAPEIALLVDRLGDGRIFRMHDASATPGHETSYLAAWDDMPPR